MPAEATGKTLYLLRHATTQPAGSNEDAQRILSRLGQQEAYALGLVMKQKNYHPDLVLCSTATRTRETLEGISDTVNLGCIQYEDDIYRGDTDDLLKLICGVDDQFVSVLVVGHNPVIHRIVLSLAGSGPESLQRSLQDETYRPGT